MLNNNININ